MKKFLIIFIILVSAGLYAATIRGVQGNPTPTDIKNGLEAAGQPFELSPERNRYAQIMSWIDYSSFGFPNDVARIVVPDLGYANGQFVSVYPPGFTLLTVPFYFFGKIFGFAQLATFTMPSLFALASFCLIVLICRSLNMRVVSAYAAGLIFLFATPAWAYSISLYQHTITTALLLLLIYLYVNKESFRSSLLFWLVAIWAVMIDYPNVFFVTPIALAFVFKHVSVDSITRVISLRFKTVVLIGMIAILPVLGFWFYYNQQTFNDPLFVSAAATPVRGLNEDGSPIFPQKNTEGRSPITFLNLANIDDGLQTLFVSKDRGLILYSPIMLFAIIGAIILYRKYGRFTQMLLWTIGLIVFVYSAWFDPWGGWAFGPRYLIPALGLSSIFLAQAIDQYGKKILFIVPFLLVTIYSLLINTLGAITSSQIPPYHEAIGIGMKYNFALNWDYLRSGVGGSFVYNTFFSNLLSLQFYAYVLFGMVLVLLLLALYFVWTTPKKLLVPKIEVPL